MADVNDRFAEALRRRSAADVPLCRSPTQARQAGLPEEAVTAAAAEAMGMDFIEDLSGLPVSHDFLTSVPIGFARRHAVIGLASENGTMPVAFSDVARWPQLEVLGKLLGREIKPLLAPQKEILRAINLAYQTQSGQAEQVIQELDGGDVLGDLQRMNANEDLLDVAARAPVIKLVNLVLLEAVKRRASDVHVQPHEDKLVVRFRIDGLLHDVFEPPAHLHPEIISRIKVMGGMNIAERRLAQDGRATVEVGDRIVDLRIATLPTSFGERAVIRLLDKSIRLYELGELGMPAAVLDAFRQLIRIDHGLILVTGPTGSGKSTTLYAALQELNASESNVITLEDPIEYRLKGISQTQVSDKKGMTFASGLRHVLRQDPDIIMVGEIRDSETARMAIQSALTGHLVFSTLHTNDSAGAVTRMLDLDVEPYLVASSLLGVQAQRLVRRICPKCRMPYSPTPADLHRWNLKEDEISSESLYFGKGCDDCLGTGYHDRVGIFELLLITEPIRELILKREKSSTIKANAISAGMTTLRSDGLAKAKGGITTMDEVVLVTGRDEF
jgi:general secretion pathway protein E